MPYVLPSAKSLTAGQIALFRQNGFLPVRNAIPSEIVELLLNRFEPLFRGEFETGVYPDEWYWREGISLPEATRHMSNLWKSDLTVARLILSPDIAEAAASLAGWPGVRLGQDTLWMKMPGAPPIALHQDTSFMNFLEPAESITAWIALDDTKTGSGTIAYVPGSQHWPLQPMPDEFHAPQSGWQSQMLAAAGEAGVGEPIVQEIEVPAGSILFHSGSVWHGSGPNNSTNVMRRSLGIHYLHPDVRFGPDGGGYIYGRYQRNGDDSLDESFFPFTWCESGYRSSYIDRYCETGKRI